MNITTAKRNTILALRLLLPASTAAVGLEAVVFFLAAETTISNGFPATVSADAESSSAATFSGSRGVSSNGLALRWAKAAVPRQTNKETTIKRLLCSFKTKSFAKWWRKDSDLSWDFYSNEI